MPLFDTHAHYNLAPLYANWQAYQSQAQAAAITHTLVVGTDLKTCHNAIQLKKAAANFFLLSLGLHPNIVYQNNQLISESELGKICHQWSELVKKNRPILSAIGECGLDFFQIDKSSPIFPHLLERQIKLLKLQLHLAKELALPIVLHVRDSNCQQQSDNAYQLICQQVSSLTPNAKLIWHCFSGEPWYLQQVLAMPHSYISFAGNLTFKNAPALRELFSQVPAEKLLLETDAPFLSPEPVRGQICQPAFLAHTGKLAASLGADLEQIYQNSCSLFGEVEI